jgi:phenol 2-monooxygenase
MARSLEMFESIGILQDIQKECSNISEIRFWGPDPETGRLRRTSAIPQDQPGDSRFILSVLHQGRVEHHLNESSFKNSNGSVVVERGVLPESLDIDTSAVGDQKAYPVTVRLRHLVENNGYRKVGERQPEIDGMRLNCVKCDNIDDATSGMYRSTLLSAEEQDSLQCASSVSKTHERMTLTKLNGGKLERPQNRSQRGCIRKICRWV